MRLPNLRRSRETEYQSLPAQQPSATALGKWESMLSPDEAEQLEQPHQNKKHEQESSPRVSPARSRGLRASPREYEDSAHPRMQQERTKAQMMALDAYQLAGVFA